MEVVGGQEKEFPINRRKRSINGKLGVGVRASGARSDISAEDCPPFSLNILSPGRWGIFPCEQ